MVSVSGSFTGSSCSCWTGSAVRAKHKSSVTHWRRRGQGAGPGGGGYLAGTHDSSCTEADLIKRKQRKNKQTISRLSAQASHFERGRQLLSLVSSRPMTPAASQPLAVSRMRACLFAMRASVCNFSTLTSLRWAKCCPNSSEVEAKSSSRLR